MSFLRKTLWSFFGVAVALTLTASMAAAGYVQIPPALTGIFTRDGTPQWSANDDGNEVLTETCAAAGTQLTDADGNAQNPAAGLHWVTCQVEDCFLCDASACASPDGVLFPSGFAGFVDVPTAGAYACRSVGSAGVIRMHPLN